MLTNKRLLLPGIGIAVVAAFAVAIGVFAATSGDGSDGDDGRESVSADDQGAGGGSGGVAAVCVEGVPDCEDMIVNPDGDVSDEPVSADDPIGPITSIDDIDPDECNLVHNIDACQEQATAAAVADLAKNTGLAADSITVENAEFTQWPDACLGVQDPKTACAEVITPGFNLVLEADGVTYEYRTDATGTMVVGGK